MKEREREKGERKRGEGEEKRKERVKQGEREGKKTWLKNAGDPILRQMIETQMFLEYYFEML